MKGINGTAKREEAVERFQRRKIRVVCLDGEESCRGLNGIIAGIQEMERDREGLAILLNDVGHSAVIDFGCVSSRILWIKFKFSRVKVCGMVGCGPIEGDEVRDRFWNDNEDSG